ncbi:HNH endonuclease signature motif containing protein [Frankia sp. R43]|uniref:HNH endonuclease signature motif containing protein n=1 Tax=Frankia sp. R43 TaxID=269536 RepID=UPI0006CA26A4|nr:HNH endonuclease signature motif containing protein [Frankia sp. R43]
MASSTRSTRTDPASVSRVPVEGDGEGVPVAHRVFEGWLNECLERLRVAVAGIAAAQAVAIRVQAELAAARPPEGYDELGLFGSVVAGEVAGLMRISTGSAEWHLDFADQVVRRIPVGLEALAAGVLDLPRLRSLERATAPLDVGLAGRVVDHVLAKGPRAHRRSFTAACRRGVIKIDPEGAARRSEERCRERRVWVEPEEDGMAVLGALLPADGALACRKRIERIADATIVDRAEEDGRSRDEVRADTLMDLILGRYGQPGPAGAAGADVQVIVPIGTLLGLDADPGELVGYGPIPAVVAREIASRPASTWRRMLTDGLGSLVELGERRYPSPGQRRHVQVRNPCCTFPHCTRGAWRCDLDHTRPYAAGGKTLVENLGPLCRRHHRVRHHSRWRVVQPRPGVFRWTSPTGRRYEVRPHSYLDGECATVELDATSENGRPG